jgi:hypothetical protein
LDRRYLVQASARILALLAEIIFERYRALLIISLLNDPVSTPELIWRLQDDHKGWDLEGISHDVFQDIVHALACRD